MTQSGHKFAHVTTSDMWHVQNVIWLFFFCHSWARCIFTRVQCWAHKYFVKWLSGIIEWPQSEIAMKVSWFLYPPQQSYGGMLDSPCLFVCPSVCPLTFRVRPVASTVQDGFFPYLVQMINSMRGCVACDDPWPWPLPSRSFGLDLENHVCSVAFAVLDGFFLCLAQMITIIRGCLACYIIFRIWKFEFLAN